MVQRYNPDYVMHAARFEPFARETEHGEFVRFEDHQQVVSAVEADLDALADRVNSLAVENQALKARTVTVPTKVYVKDMRCNVVRWAQVVDALSEAGVAFVRDDGELIAGTRETPATDAALSAIQAQGVEKFADDLHKTAMALCSVKPDNTAPGAYAGLARSFAKKLREAK